MTLKSKLSLVAILSALAAASTFAATPAPLSAPPAPPAKNSVTAAAPTAATPVKMHQHAHKKVVKKAHPRKVEARTA